MDKWYSQQPVYRQTSMIETDHYSSIGLKVDYYLVTIYENQYPVYTIKSDKFYTQEEFETNFLYNPARTRNMSTSQLINFVSKLLPDNKQWMLEAIRKANSTHQAENPSQHLIDTINFVEENEDGTFNLLPLK